MIRPASPQQTTAFVLAALAPGATIQATVFGDGVLANIAIAVVTAVAVEASIAKLRGTAPTDVIRDGSGIVTAVLLALALPPAVPVGVVIVGVLIAIGIGKHAFGGAGANPFNPAMVGYVALLLSFPAALATWPATTGVDGVTGATVLDAFKHRGGLTVADFWTPAHGFGSSVSSAWEWLNVAYLVGGSALIAARVIDWRIPLSILATVGLVAAINYDGGSSSSLGSPLFHWLSGGTMLGAFFIATDPVTSPTTARGRIYYGVLIGATLFAIRAAPTYPDGIAFAVLLGNAAAPLIDRAATPARCGCSVSIASAAWRLGLVGAVVAAALGGVDALTRARIQANEQRVLLVPLVEVTGDARLADLRGGSTPPLTVCSASGAPLYSVFGRSVRGYAGPIQLLIGVDAKQPADRRPGDQPSRDRRHRRCHRDPKVAVDPFVRPAPSGGHCVDRRRRLHRRDHRRERNLARSDQWCARRGSRRRRRATTELFECRR